MTQNTKIYLADDKDGNKVIVVGYSSYLDSFPTAIKVGEWFEDVNDWDESWADEPWIFEIDELFRVMRRPCDFMYDEEYCDDLTVDKIQYGYYQLKNLCKRIVAGSEEPVTVGCSIHYANGRTCMYSGWSAYATIDPVLAQAILDTYN